MKVQRPRLHHYMLLLYDSRGCINILLTISVCNVLENIDHKCFTGVLIENTPLAIFSVLGCRKEVRWQSTSDFLQAAHAISTFFPRHEEAPHVIFSPHALPSLQNFCFFKTLSMRAALRGCQKKFTSTEIFLVG